MGKIVGIDLGTTNSAVAVMEGGDPVVIPTADASGPKHLQMKLTRAKFGQLTEDLVERCRGPFQRALKDANLSAQDLDEVILVGGATRMPMIQELVQSLTHKGPVHHAGRQRRYAFDRPGGGSGRIAWIAQKSA